MPKRKRGEKPTPAQHRAVMTNLARANLGRQKRLFNLLGHHDFEKLIEDLDAKFRAKVKGLK